VSKRVLLAVPRGYCAGVVQAEQTVKKALDVHGAPVYVREQIVQNKNVVDILEKRGGVFVKETDEGPEGAIVISSTHCVAPIAHEEAKAHSIKTVEATRQLVTKVHYEARGFAEFCVWTTESSRPRGAKMSKQTPFHNVGLAAGAEMRELFGYWLPWQYASGHIAEHMATREGVSICDLDYMAEFQIKGRGSHDFVQQLLTNDFTNLAVGQVRYTAMCDEDGNMVDDGTLWRVGDDEYVLITGNEGDGNWITGQAKAFDVEVTNLTSVWTTLAVQGPKSQKVVEALVDPEQVRSLRYYRFIRTTVMGFDCTLARMGYTGEKGYEFHVHPQIAERLWLALLEAGADDGILPCGQAALESLRQEAGYLLVGSDHDSTTNPFEAGIGRVVKLSKPEFSGRTALTAIRRAGVNRTLVWLTLDDDTVVCAGDKLSIDDEAIGSVTSGSFSPTLRHGVAMGYVAPRYAIPGISIDITTAVGLRKGKLSTMPLYDAGDLRTRSN
jgi:aminomethyltransferase